MQEMTVWKFRLPYTAKRFYPSLLHAGLLNDSAPVVRVLNSFHAALEKNDLSECLRLTRYVQIYREMRDEAGDWAGKSLSMRSAEGDLVACEIVTLPFYDAEKRIPRGLDKSIP